MIDKIGTNQIRDMVEQSAARQTDSAKLPPEIQADATLNVDFDARMAKAAQVPESDPATIERAKELMLSGELEKPENFLAAAKNIIDLGI